MVSALLIPCWVCELIFVHASLLLQIKWAVFPEKLSLMTEKPQEANSCGFLCSDSEIAQHVGFVILQDLACVESVVTGQDETDHTDKGKQMDIQAAKHLHAEHNGSQR